MMLTSVVKGTAGMSLLDAAHLAIEEAAHRLMSEGGAIARIEVEMPDEGLTISLFLASHQPGTHLTLTVSED
jgi:hypothetical protein